MRRYLFTTLHVKGALLHNYLKMCFLKTEDIPYLFMSIPQVGNKNGNESR